MIKKLPSIASIILLYATLLACSSLPKLTNIDTPTEIHRWERQLPSSQGQLIITFNLIESAKARIIFNDGEPMNPQLARVQLYFSNISCDIGHQASITYQANSRDWLTKYFDSEIPWNTNNQLGISWDKQKMTIAINNEKIELDLAGNLDQVKFLASRVPIKIEKLEYLATK